jgi:hypothetical protein
MEDAMRTVSEPQSGSGPEDALRKSERLRLDAEALGHVGTWEHDFRAGPARAAG